MNSIEKVQNVAGEYSGPPAEDDGPLELMLRTATMTMGPTFLSMLPEDPAVMDAGLLEIAVKLLELRSDDAAGDVRLAALEGGSWQPLQLEAGPAGE